MCFAANSAGDRVRNAAIIGGAAAVPIFAGIASYAQAQSANRAAGYNAGIAAINRDLALYNAREAVAEGRRQVSAHRQELRSLQGTQRARTAAAGVEATSGTPLAIYAETKQLGELDALDLEYGARQRAWGYEVEAAQHETRRRLARASRVNTGLQVASTVLGSATQMFSAVAPFLQRGG